METSLEGSAVAGILTGTVAKTPSLGNGSQEHEAGRNQ